MIDHGPWITQIKNSVTALNSQVYDVAQFVRDVGAWESLPAAYVYPAADMAGEEYATTKARQVIHTTMAVLIVVGATGTTDQAFSTLSTIRSAICAALLAWKPTGCFEYIRYAGGQGEELINSAFIWEDRYTSAYILET